MSDTIAAIATARAPSAIGILRLTGEDTAAILDKVFRPKGQPMSARSTRAMVLGDVLDRTGQVIDNGLAVLMRAPNSYTGEDCAEIHCHGSPVVLQEVPENATAVGVPAQIVRLNGRKVNRYVDEVDQTCVADPTQQKLCMLTSKLERLTKHVAELEEKLEAQLQSGENTVQL